MQVGECRQPGLEPWELLRVSRPQAQERALDARQDALGAAPREPDADGDGQEDHRSSRGGPSEARLRQPYLVRGVSKPIEPVPVPREVRDDLGVPDQCLIFDAVAARVPQGLLEIAAPGRQVPPVERAELDQLDVCAYRNVAEPLAVGVLQSPDEGPAIATRAEPCLGD